MRVQKVEQESPTAFLDGLHQKEGVDMTAKSLRVCYDRLQASVSLRVCYDCLSLSPPRELPPPWRLAVPSQDAGGDGHG